MRHKILLGLHGLLEETGVCLGGVSELDETFVLDSYKGGSLPEDAARPARRHGAKAQRGAFRTSMSASVPAWNAKGMP